MAQHSLYPNASWGERSRETPSINTLLSLTPCLIFSSFYHSRSLRCLPVGSAVLWLAEKMGQVVDCVFILGLGAALLAGIHPFASAAVGLLFRSDFIYKVSVTKDPCNLFALEKLPHRHIFHVLPLSLSDFSQNSVLARTLSRIPTVQADKKEHTWKSC